MSRRLLVKVYGCLIGGAIGDAMGAPAEDWHYSDIRPKFGRIDSCPTRAVARWRTGADYRRHHAAALHVHCDHPQRGAHQP